MSGIYGQIGAMGMSIKYQIDKLDIILYNIEADGYGGAQQVAEVLLQKMYDTLPMLKHTKHRLYDTYRTGTIAKDNPLYECFNVIFEVTA